jgi:hypothetical protein
MENEKSKCADNSLRIKRLDTIYGRVLGLRNFEIQNLNTRNSFISAANIGLFAFAARQTDTSWLLALLGIFVSGLQIQMAAGAKYWQEVWEHKLADMERKLYQVYTDENKLNSSPSHKFDPFVHLFTPEKMDGYTNNETINSEFYERQEDEIYKIMKGKLQADCWVNSIILKKYSVSRTPIYLGMVMAGFWVLLLLKIILCK